MTGQTNTGGGNIGAQRKGTIVVTYPAGATCTVTNGSQTYTALDTSGAAAFIVEPGTWTVQAVQGSDSNSESVTVTAGGWVEVELLFALYIFKSGEGFLYEYGSFNGDWASLNIGTDAITATHSTGYSGQIFGTKDTIDITDYNKLNIDIVVTSANGSSQPSFGVAKKEVWNFGTNKDSFDAYVSIPSTTSRKIFSLDISTMTGDYYFGFCADNAFSVYDIWFST